MKRIKKFENFTNDDIELSDYFIGDPDKQYVDFEYTNDPFETADGRIVGNHHNSFSSFRKDNKRIIPTDDMINSVVDVVGELLGDSINHHKYYPEYKQIYFYTYFTVGMIRYGRTTMSYSEREETNMKKLIIDFYTNDWIFVALCDENDIGTKEKHSICKGLNGLKEFLTDKKEYISKK
jgi:hypothetical protein